MSFVRNIVLILVAMAALLSLGCSNSASAEPTSVASIPTTYQAYGDSSFLIYIPRTWSPDEAFKLLVIEAPELAVAWSNNPDARLHETDSLLFYASGPSDEGSPNVGVISTENPSDTTTESFSNLVRHDTSVTMPSGVLGDERTTIGTGAGSAQIWSIRGDGSDIMPDSSERVGYIVLTGASTKKPSEGNVIKWTVMCSFIVDSSRNANHDRDCRNMVNS